MQRDLETRFSALERRREDLTGRLADLGERALSFKPRKEAWCLLEVCDHVLRTEEASLQYVRKKLPHVEANSRPGARSRWVFPILRVLLALPLRFRMPSSVSDSLKPGSSLSLEKLVDRWIAEHSEWRRVLDSVPASKLQSPLFRHPIAGPMDLNGALLFLEAHFDHHLRQVERLFGHEDFPRSVGPEAG